MYRSGLFVVLAFLLVSTLAVAEEYQVPNPLRDARVGDWVLYKLSEDGKNQQKMTVVKREGDGDALKITVKFDNMVNGKLVNSGQSVQSGGDFSNTISSAGKPGTTTEVGIEDVMVKDAALTCTVVTVTPDNAKDDSVYDEWYLSEEVPIFGVVRQIRQGMIESDLIDYGRGQ